MYFTEVTRRHTDFTFCLQCRRRTSLVNKLSQPYAFLHKNVTQVYYPNHFLRTSSITGVTQPENTIVPSFFWKRDDRGEELKAEEIF